MRNWSFLCKGLTEVSPGCFTAKYSHSSHSKSQGLCDFCKEEKGVCIYQSFFFCPGHCTQLCISFEFAKKKKKKGKKVKAKEFGFAVYVHVSCFSLTVGRTVRRFSL